MPSYQCQSGEVIEYPEPTPEIAAYLERAKAMAANPLIGEPGMYQVVYSEENPLLEMSPVGRKNFVTRAVLDNPIYRILRDLVEVKLANLGLIDMNEVAAEYTVSVTDAAKQLGITPGAVRAAIAARKLDGFMRNGQWYLHPDSVASYKPSNRGRGNAKVKTASVVRVRVGGSAGVSLSVRLVGGELEDAADGKQFPSGWKKAIVRTVATTLKGKTVRVFEIEPAENPEEIHVGDQFVKGPFRIIKRINNLKQANEAWKAGV